MIKKDIYAKGTKIICLRSIDPNEIDGPEGIDSIRWKAQKDTLLYTLHFENSAKTATGPAQRIYLEHPLPAKADPSQFRVGRIGFAGKVFELPLDRPVYQGRLDARDSTGVFVDVTVGVDINTRKAFWVLQSVDPATGLTPPADKGLLPVNDAVTHKGEGFVEFTLKALTSTVTGDTLQARGSIVFDNNDAIPTNIWTNTIDAVAPLSKMTATVSGVIDTTVG